MSTNTLHKSFRVCATCTLWCGQRTADTTRTTICFERNQKGECAVQEAALIIYRCNL